MKKEGMTMKKYIVKRIWQMLLVLFLVSVFCFSLVRLIPGDPVKAVFGEGAASSFKNRSLSFK